MPDFVKTICFNIWLACAIINVALIVEEFTTTLEMHKINYKRDGIIIFSVCILLSILTLLFMAIAGGPIFTWYVATYKPEE